MTLYNIFNTKEEAEAAQEEDYTLLLKRNSGVDKYCQDTVRWSDVLELPEGKWGYAVYHSSDHVYSTVDFTTPETTVD